MKCLPTKLFSFFIFSLIVYLTLNINLSSKFYLCQFNYNILLFQLKKLDLMQKEWENGLKATFWGNEQLTVPGVLMPDIFTDDFVSWWIIEGTQIGYNNVYSWMFNSFFSHPNRSIRIAITTCNYSFNIPSFIL